MLKSYRAFEKSIDEIMKLRSRNYVNTDCNVSLLVNVVYAEIATEIVLKWHVYDFDIDTSLRVYELPRTNNPADDSESTVRYENIYDIADKEGNDISHLFDVNIDQTELSISAENIELYNGLNVRVLRAALPDIETLEIPMYSHLFKPIVEGIMFMIQDSVPSETDGKLGNLQYQRFFNAKKLLKQQMPERESIVTKQVGNNTVRRNAYYDTRY